MEGEAVIEAVQEQAASEAVAGVAGAVAQGDAIISDQVQQVAAALEDHAQTSEERHEEILEGESECQDGQQLLMMAVTGLQSSLLSFQQSMQAQGAATLAELQTLNQRLSTGSRQLSPEPVEPPPVVEPPANGGEGHQEPPPVKKRRVNPI